VSRYILLFSAFCFFLVSCKESTSTAHKKEEDFKPTGKLSDLVYNPVRADGTIDSSYLPIMEMPDTIFDFGSIFQGDVSEKHFSFKNTGTAPLLITDVISSCGCTVPSWTENPIPPDSTGIITVRFDSKNKEGAQNKQVTIFANTIPNKKILSIQGNVVKN
jgi:hypothetical protein